MVFLKWILIHCWYYKFFIRPHSFIAFLLPQFPPPPPSPGILFNVRQCDGVIDRGSLTGVHSLSPPPRLLVSKIVSCSEMFPQQTRANPAVPQSAPVSYSVVEEYLLFPGVWWGETVWLECLANHQLSQSYLLLAIWQSQKMILNSLLHPKKSF